MIKTCIPIFDVNGIQINEIEIPDKLHYVNGRVSKGKKGFYKGTGVPYNGHTIYELDQSNINDYEILGKSDIFYIGYNVSKICFENKFGIFQERYQNFFPDFIGACSVKEGTIVLNSSAFEKTSVNVIDFIEFDPINKQSYYILDYSCGRKRYIENDGNPKKLRELVDLTLKTDWNFLWDKATINDISHTGLVSDPADLFLSDKIEHKFGSVYSVLYSLGKLSKKKYFEFIKQYNLDHLDDRYYVFNAARILNINGIDISELFPLQNMHKNYIHILLNYLLVGQNCAYCACNMFVHNGDKVRNEYIEMLKKQISDSN